MTACGIQARLLLLGLLAAALAAGTGGCSPAPEASPSRPSGVLVVSTIYPLHAFALHLAGPGDRAVLLAPPGVEPHDWEPSPREAALVRRADVLVTSGGLEPWLARTRATLPPSVREVNARRVLAPSGGPADPHWWLDPVRAASVADALAAALSQARPAEAPGYTRRAALLRRRLLELDRRYREGLQGCRQRVMVVSHAAFGYLAQRYELVQVAVSGLTPGDEPGPRRLAEIAALMRREGIRHVFVEPLGPARTARALAAATGAAVVPLHTLEGLTPAEARAGKDYFSIMEENLARLRSALGCGV